MDVLPLVYHFTVDALATPILFIALPGARVLRGDYRRMAKACHGLCVDIAVIVSMGTYWRSSRVWTSWLGS